MLSRNIVRFGINSRCLRGRVSPIPSVSSFNIVSKRFNTYESKDKSVKKEKTSSFNQHIMNEEGSQLSHEEQEQMQKTYELTQRASAIVLGVTVIAGILVSFEIYNNWSVIKYKVFGISNSSLNQESFDQLFEEIQAKKLMKQQSLEKETFTLSNPNDSSVPGVYICGNNENGLVNPSQTKNVKFQTIFKRLDFFDNMTLRDLQLGERSGAAIDDKGNLYQWGKGFDNSRKSLEAKGKTIQPSLKGENLTKVQISNGVLYLLKSNGEVIYLPESKKEQTDFQNNSTNTKRNWKTLYLSKTFENKPYRKLDIPSRSKIEDISAGKEHLVLLSKDGLVYSLATGLKQIPQSKGQFGIPSLSQFDEPPAPNVVHEITLLNKYIEDGNVSKRKINQIATGDFFTMCLDNLGYIWTFGKNTYGSLGKPINYNSEIIPYPVKVESIMKHFGKADFPQAINIAAGGQTAFATYVSSNIYHLFEKSLKGSNTKNKNSTSLDLTDLTDSQQNSLTHFAWGHGLKGELGIGHFIHGQAEPHKIKSLNEIKEYNEITNKIETTGIKDWSIGRNHAFVTLANNDVYCWGDNEFGQLGNGKRIRLGAPSTIMTLREPQDPKKVKKIYDPNNRLNLSPQQSISCGVDTTAIYYKKL